jgi:hypothetical protein
MSASDHINPHHLRTVAQEHGKRYFKDFDDLEKRQKGMCYEYSDHFIEHGGVSGAHLQPYEAGGDFGHATVHVPTTNGPYIVDFTSNQFDPHTPVPLVEPRHRYEKRLERHFGSVERNPARPENDPIPSSPEHKRRGPSDPMEYAR